MARYVTKNDVDGHGPMVSIVEFTGDGAFMGRRPSTIPTCQ